MSNTLKAKAPIATLKLMRGMPGMTDHYIAMNKGRSDTGVVVLHGARVSDTVELVWDLSGGASRSARFESAISVDGQIQMTNATDDLSAANLLFVIKRG